MRSGRSITKTTVTTETFQHDREIRRRSTKLVAALADLPYKDRLKHLDLYSLAIFSLAWPDPIFAQGVYCLPYKRPREKGLEQFTAATGTATIAVVMGVN